jgi:hypothetical protein
MESKTCAAFETQNGNMGFGYQEGEVTAEGTWMQCKSTVVQSVQYGPSSNQNLNVCERHATFARHLASMVLS